jgi:hypothetical protein
VTVRGASYLRCPACGYVRVTEDRVPTREQAEARYRLHRNDPAEPGYRAYLTSFIEAAVRDIGEPGIRVLDVGSGPVAALSEVLGRYGYVVQPWDPIFSPELPRYPKWYELALLHEVAEHLERPYATLAWVARRLLPRGAIAIRTRFVPEDPELFASWWYREDPTHIGFFAARTFGVMAARLGARVELVREPDIVVLRRGLVDWGGGA